MLASPPARRLRRVAVTLAYLGLCALCVAAVMDALSDVGVHGVVAALGALPAGALALAATSVCAVFAVMWAMERLALRDAGVRRLARRAWPVPLIANALSLGAGFGAVSGAAVRMRLYARSAIVPGVALFVASSVTFMSIGGGILLAALGFLAAPHALSRSLSVTPALLQGLGAAVFATLAAGLALAGPKARVFAIAGRTFRLPRGRGWAGRLSLGMLDWLASAATLYVLLPHQGQGEFLSFAASFAAIHLLAMATGAPGGLGVFDALMLAANPSQAPPERLAAALICYRLLSFVAPLVLGLFGFAAMESAALPGLGRPTFQRLQARLTHAALQALARRRGFTDPPSARGAQTKSDAFMGRRFLPPVTLQALTGGGPVLVLAPHPDDETLGCGGLLAACAAAGVAAHVAILTDGSRSHIGSRTWRASQIATRRAHEAISALRRLGIDANRVHFFNHRDGELFFSAPAYADAATRIGDLAARLRVRRIFVTWPHDPHPDHVAAAAIARGVRARLKHVRIVYYPIWGRFLPDSVALRDRRWRAMRFDIRPFHRAKREALGAYRSQISALISDARIAHRIAEPHLRALSEPYELYFF